MKGPTLAEIKLVLFAPMADSRSGLAVWRACNDFLIALNDFRDRATPRRWEVLVAASRRVHREWQKARRK